MKKKCFFVGATNPLDINPHFHYDHQKLHICIMQYGIIGAVINIQKKVPLKKAQNNKIRFQIVEHRLFFLPTARVWHSTRRGS